MNIFAVYRSPKTSARCLPDKLVVKMPVETAQMLSTAIRVHCGDGYCDSRDIYKVAFKNHPCTIWARSSRANYDWLVKHFKYLCREYRSRYGKVHGCAYLLKPFQEASQYMPSGNLTEFAQAMPDIYKTDNHVQAYRDYMVNEKHYAQWRYSGKPQWWPVKSEVVCL